MRLLDESNYPKGYASVKIRYVGVLENIQGARLALSLMLAMNSAYVSPKTSGEEIIQASMWRKVLTWLDQVCSANPKQAKYRSLVVLENSFYLLDGLRALTLTRVAAAF